MHVYVGNWYHNNKITLLPYFCYSFLSLPQSKLFKLSWRKTELLLPLPKPARQNQYSNSNKHLPQKLALLLPAAHHQSLLPRKRQRKQRQRKRKLQLKLRRRLQLVVVVVVLLQGRKLLDQQPKEKVNIVITVQYCMVIVTVHV